MSDVCTWIVSHGQSQSADYRVCGRLRPSGVLSIRYVILFPFKELKEERLDAPRDVVTKKTISAEELWTRKNYVNREGFICEACMPSVRASIEF